MMGATLDTLGVAESLAYRLRAVQSDLAGEDEGFRRAAMRDELESGLSALMPDEQREVLLRLRDLFPGWDGDEPAAPGAGPAAESPVAAAKRLAARAQGLPAAEREAVLDALAEGGLLDAGTRAADVGPAERLREKLGQPGPLSGERVAELAADLAEAVLAIERITWQTWRQLAPRSAVRRGRPLMELAGRFASGDAEVGRSQVAEELERLRQLNAALISSLSQVGAVTHRQMSAASPDMVELGVRQEKRKWNDTLEAACWRRYRELCAERDEAAVEREIMRSIAEYAESLIRGLAS